MSNFMIALLVAIATGTWVYTKMMKSSGGLTKNAMVVAGVSSLLVFIVVLSLIGMLT